MTAALKAKQLLSRRDGPNSAWYYLRRDWRRQCVVLMAYVAIVVVLWLQGFTMGAIAIGCFFAGTKIRDVRWWMALAREWPTTRELLDWQKIEAIANGSANS